MAQAVTSLDRRLREHEYGKHFLHCKDKEIQNIKEVLEEKARVLCLKKV